MQPLFFFFWREEDTRIFRAEGFKIGKKEPVGMRHCHSEDAARTACLRFVDVDDADFVQVMKVDNPLDPEPECVWAKEFKF